MTANKFLISGSAAGNSPLTESWQFDSGTTSHICGYQKTFVRYTEYDLSEEVVILDFAGNVADIVIRHGDVRLRMRLP